MRLLVKNGAHVNDKSENGWTALLWCSIQGDIEPIEYLVHDVGLSVDCESECGETAVDIALQSGNDYVAEWLLTNGCRAKSLENVASMTAVVNLINRISLKMKARFQSSCSSSDSACVENTDYQNIAIDSDEKDGLSDTDSNDEVKITEEALVQSKSQNCLQGALKSNATESDDKVAVLAVGLRRRISSVIGIKAYNSACCLPRQMSPKFAGELVMSMCEAILGEAVEYEIGACAEDARAVVRSEGTSKESILELRAKLQSLEAPRSVMVQLDRVVQACESQPSLDARRAIAVVHGALSSAAATSIVDESLALGEINEKDTILRRRMSEAQQELSRARTKEEVNDFRDAIAAENSWVDKSLALLSDMGVLLGKVRTLSSKHRALQARLQGSAASADSDLIRITSTMNAMRHTLCERRRVLAEYSARLGVACCSLADDWAVSLTSSGPTSSQRHWMRRFVSLYKAAAASGGSSNFIFREQGTCEDSLNLAKSIDTFVGRRRASADFKHSCGELYNEVSAQDVRDMVNWYKDEKLAIVAREESALVAAMGILDEQHRVCEQLVAILRETFTSLSARVQTNIVALQGHDVIMKDEIPRVYRGIHKKLLENERLCQASLSSIKARISEVSSKRETAYTLRSMVTLDGCAREMEKLQQDRSSEEARCVSIEVLVQRAFAAVAPFLAPSDVEQIRSDFSRVGLSPRIGGRRARRAESRIGSPASSCNSSMCADSSFARIQSLNPGTRHPPIAVLSEFSSLMGPPQKPKPIATCAKSGQDEERKRKRETAENAEDGFDLKPSLNNRVHSKVARGAMQDQKPSAAVVNRKDHAAALQAGDGAVWGGIVPTWAERVVRWVRGDSPNTLSSEVARKNWLDAKQNKNYTEADLAREAKEVAQKAFAARQKECTNDQSSRDSGKTDDDSQSIEQESDSFTEEENDDIANTVTPTRSIAESSFLRWLGGYNDDLFEDSDYES